MSVQKEVNLVGEVTFANNIEIAKFEETKILPVEVLKRGVEFKANAAHQTQIGGALTSFQLEEEFIATPFLDESLAAEEEEEEPELESERDDD